MDKQLKSATIIKTDAEAEKLEKRRKELGLATNNETTTTNHSPDITEGKKTSKKMLDEKKKSESFRRTFRLPHEETPLEG